jgi:AcrR family transcriptional regulator
MDVRLEILRVATRQFATRGFDGTSLKDLADEVGIRKPSLLYHYPSKEQLRLAVLEQLLNRWNEVLPRLLMAAAGGERRFESVIRETVRFFAEDPDRARLLVREILDRPEDMRKRLVKYVSPWLDVVADYIRRGQEHDEVYDEVDPEAYILQITNLVVSGVAAAASLDGGLLPPDSPRGDPATRHTRELVRIARFSLFCAPPLGAPSSLRTMERGESASIVAADAATSQQPRHERLDERQAGEEKFP